MFRVRKNRAPKTIAGRFVFLHCRGNVHVVSRCLGIGENGRQLARIDHEALRELGPEAVSGDVVMLAMVLRTLPQLLLDGAG